MKELYMLGILKVYDYTTDNPRMTVLVRNMHQKNCQVFTKGAPEIIKKCCKKDTIPADFKKKLYIHTSKGERVIALACKQININVINYDKIPREKLETNMYFLGFVTIRNKIKEKEKK